MNETLYLVDQQETPGRLIRFTIEHEIEQEVPLGTLMIHIIMRAHDTCGPVTAGRAYLTSVTRKQSRRRQHTRGFSDWHIYQIKSDMEEATKSNPLYDSERTWHLEGPSFQGSFFGMTSTARHIAEQMFNEGRTLDDQPFLIADFPY